MRIIRRVNKLVVVAGNIGSGKTTLTRQVGERLGWQTAYESVADNPYLADFYQDMASWSFHLQIYFLGSRARQYLETWQSGAPAIIDRSIFEDAHIFARALHHLGNLTDKDYEAFLQVYHLVVASLPPPALLVYLRAPVPVLLERIRQRARGMEAGISASYLELLDGFYREWLRSFDLCPVLTIHSNAVNFAGKPRHLDKVITAMQEKLRGQGEIRLED